MSSGIPRYPIFFPIRYQYAYKLQNLWYRIPEAKSKATICPALFDATLCTVLNERFFLPGSRVGIYSNESTKREFWMLSLSLLSPLTACISYSNKSMKREIWKLNLELNRMCDFVVYCFCLTFNILLPVSTRKDKYCQKSYRTISKLSQVFMTKTPLRRSRIRTCT